MSRRTNEQNISWGGVASVAGLVVSIAIPALQGIGTSGDPATLRGLERLAVILVLGLAASIAYGILWIVVQKFFDWDLSEATKMPTGWQAALLSLCLTVPITFVPAIYQYVSGSLIISARHFWFAALVMNFSSAIGHILWYGTTMPPARGLRKMTFPTGTPPDRGQYVRMELTATLTHFLSTVAVYRLAADNRESLFGASSVVMPTLVSGTFFFCGICAYSLLKYPDSVTDGTWAQVRGFLAGLLLSIGLTSGILM
jgi:hypothetical protein